MYKAIIRGVEKTEDTIRITIEYTDGKKVFVKTYPLVHVVDIKTAFKETIQNELKRINDLEDAFVALKAREGEEIILKE